MPIYYETELYHYGIPGMKWGKRKSRYTNADGTPTKLGKAKMAYKDARKNERNALKATARAKPFIETMNSIQKYESAKSKSNDASLKALKAKADYKKLKSKNPNKAEFKTYERAMIKTGLPGSSSDISGNSKRIYNDLKRRKGQAYADKVAKEVQKQTVTAFITGTSLTLGYAAAQIYLATRQ